MERRDKTQWQGGERKQINVGGEETLERGNKTEEVSCKSQEKES